MGTLSDSIQKITKKKATATRIRKHNYFPYITLFTYIILYHSNEFFNCTSETDEIPTNLELLQHIFLLGRAMISPLNS